MPSSYMVTVALSGHLSREGLRRHLEEAQLQLGSEPVPLIVDCSAMTGYDNDARSLFVDWNTRVRCRLTRVAVVTSNPIWRVVIGAMALASKQSMRAFGSVPEAHAWVSEDGHSG